MTRTILIVDDNTINRQMLINTLHNEYNILEAENGKDALLILNREYKRLSAVLTDILMPEMDGYELLHEIRNSITLTQLPVIMVTGSGDEDSRVKALSLGANDFILKPFNPDIVKHCVKNTIALNETAATVKVLEKDPLTGILNRTAFFEKAGQLIREQPAGHYMLDCVDIDNFKILNDKYGIKKGDEVLKCLADALQYSCDTNGGICGRIANDDFISLYPCELAEKGIASPQIIQKRLLEGTGLSLTLSVGRYFVNNKSLDVSTMYDRAKIAQATVKGRYDTDFAMYDRSMRDTILKEQEIISDMSLAISQHQFEAWFQPQYNHSSGARIGSEALVRWRHPTKGLIAPNDFIPIFERNGFIYELDKYIWEEVCSMLRKWTDQGLSPLPVSVNISRYDLFRDDLIPNIMRLLQKYDLPVDLLRLEITESAFANDSAEIISIVKKLIANGFIVEIDDFGSGYSSLNTLKDVPAQILKIDMRFLETSNSDRGGNILESIVRMAKWIDMSVIAEGVETKEQADYLMSIGCNYVQGYFYSKPLPASEYEKLAENTDKEGKLITLKTMKSLDNNSFWDPKSMDTLIFNSYVGVACIFEYRRGEIELLRVSPKYARLIGTADINIENALRLDWAAHLDDEGKGLLKNALEESINKREDIALELNLHRIPHCPEKLFLKFHVQVIAVAGIRYLVYCTYENLTAQRDAEEKQHATADRLNSILSNISGGVVMSILENETAKILFSNDNYYRIFGYTKDEYEKLFKDNLGPILEEDMACVVSEIKAVMSTGEKSTLDFRARRKDGSIIWLKNHVVKLTLAEFPHPVQLSVLYDITNQKIIMERLRQNEEELRLALSHSETTICRFSIFDRTLHIPAEVAQKKGIPEIIKDMPHGMLALNKIDKESVDSYTDFFEEIANGGKSGSVIYRFLLPSGWAWLEARYTTVFSDDGEAAFAVISYNDVTDRLQKEAVYRKWQLSMSEKKPDSYSLFRCNLNKNTSYDMEKGLLLHGIFDNANLSFNQHALNYTSKYVCEEDRRKYLSLVNSDFMIASYYRGNLTQTLEYREKLPAGFRCIRLTIELVEAPDSNNVEAFLMYENIDEVKKEKLQTQMLIETDPLTGLLNRKSIEEKFNACTAGQAVNTISAFFIIDMDGFKEINDNFGHAIGDETLIEMGQKLRDNFREQDLICRFGGDEFIVYMHDISHLSIVKNKASLLCALLHKSFSAEVQLSASIGISVAPDNGVDFEALFNKADIALYYVKEMGKDGYALYTESMGSKALLPEAAEIEDNDLDIPLYVKLKRRMLIVDDNAINRDYLTSLFDKEFIIDTAAEGTAALIRLRKYGSGISVVLLDLMMPGLDGFAVLKKMRESLTMQSIPVIVVSGMNERETCLKAIREGATDYITKPVDADLLKLRVASAITKAENEHLRAQNRYLEIKNREAKRLAEAKRHSEELSIALHEAEQADLAKSQFLSSVSHEIRTPLNAVIGYNTIARNEMTEAKTDEARRQANMKVLDCLTKSDVASRHLLMLINDVLDMSAIESGKMKVDESPFDFRSLITSLTVMFFSQARSKGVNFEVIFDKPTEEWFIGDQLRMNQILTNLLSNAVKFTSEGGNVTLAITETGSDENSASFRFIITDTGIGMTQEYLEHIWTPFEQAEASISRRFGGTGLGLSITKNLVGLMDGNIAVKSESGIGTQFTVDMTFMRTEQPENRPIGYDFSDLNALVVDDDRNTCDYIKLLFDRCGVKCTALTSGNEAIEAFALAKKQDKPFNVCLVDWRMPQMDGFATISEIRRIAAKDLPIVVVTAYDFAEISDQAESLGIVRFISKPLFQSSLFDLLANISEKQQPIQEKGEPKYDFDGVRILLVEDNNMNMEVTKHIMTSANIAVDCAWNGQEAFDIFEASRAGTYEAILMDIHMPEVDGYQATRMIRSSHHPDAQRIPIIATTADVFAEDIAEAHIVGMNDHIAKPIDIDSLLKMLSSHMKGSDA